MPQLSSAVPVRSYTPKLKPSTVSDSPSQAGKLGDVLDASGASNEKSEMAVPATPEAVRISHVESDVEALAEMHDTLVELDHAEVSQIAPGKCDVLVTSKEPKSNPLRVTELCPDSAPFSAIWDTTGASNVSNAEDVPAEAATVTNALHAGRSPDERRHATVVTEIHAVLPHGVKPIAAVAVWLKGKKFSPETVTLSPPEPGALEMK